MRKSWTQPLHLTPIDGIRTSFYCRLHSLGSALWRGHFNYSTAFCRKRVAKTENLHFTREKIILFHTLFMSVRKEYGDFLDQFSSAIFLRTLQRFTCGVRHQGTRGWRVSSRLASCLHLKVITSHEFFLEDYYILMKYLYILLVRAHTFSVGLLRAGRYNLFFTLTSSSHGA